MGTIPYLDRFKLVGVWNNGESTIYFVNGNGLTD